MNPPREELEIASFAAADPEDAAHLLADHAGFRTTLDGSRTFAVSRSASRSTKGTKRPACTAG
jgi:hypothetical protein